MTQSHKSFNGLIQDLRGVPRESIDDAAPVIQKPTPRNSLGKQPPSCTGHENSLWTILCASGLPEDAWDASSTDLLSVT